MRFCGRATDTEAQWHCPRAERGAHAGDCWDLTVDEIHRLEPDLDILAVDLPGRGSSPGDLNTLAIADWVDSVVADIEDAGLDEVVIVGHSMAGVTVPVW